jgi:hypothetical protein
MAARYICGHSEVTAMTAMLVVCGLAGLGLAAAGVGEIFPLSAIR